ncbi:hypothetical protein OC844_007979, partial [Tilletia horrida]
LTCGHNLYRSLHGAESSTGPSEGSAMPATIPTTTTLPNKKRRMSGPAESSSASSTPCKRSQLPV